MASPGDPDRLMAWLGEQRPAMTALLATIVNTDSGSYDQAGVDAVGEILKAHLEARGLVAAKIARSGAGFCLRAIVAGGDPGSGGHVLLLVHRDTVFAKGEAAKRPFRVEVELMSRSRR